MISSDKTSPTSDREVEWQLAAPDPGAVRRWLETHRTLDGLVIDPGPTVNIHDIYFDTDDWRIFRAGYALRLRAESGQLTATLKSLRSARKDVADRRELTEKVDSAASSSTASSSSAPEQPEQAAPPETGAEPILSLRGPVGTPVRAVVGHQPLRRLFEVRTTRQKFAVQDTSPIAESRPRRSLPACEKRGFRCASGQDAIAEVAIDDTTLSPPHSAPLANLQRVEIEAFGQNHDPVEKLMKQLSAECGLTPVSESKFAAGLKAAGLAPTVAPLYTPNVVEASMRIDEVVLAGLRQHWSTWIQHEPGARLGEDPRELHTVRVCARRMHAMLGLFKAHLNQDLVQLRITLKKLLGAFGEVRDLDMQRAELARFAGDLPAAQSEAAQPLLQHLESEHLKARGNMLRLLDARATERWSKKLTRLILQTSVSGEPQAAVAAAPGLIRARQRKLRKAAHRLSDASPVSDFHEVRIRAKKLRYAIDTLAPIYGKPAQEMIRALRRIQNRLGEMQDAEVATRRLIALATDTSAAFPPLTLYVMGRYGERRAQSVDGMRDRFAKVYRKMHRKRWKALRAAMLDLAPAAGAEADKTEKDNPPPAVPTEPPSPETSAPSA